MIKKMKTEVFIIDKLNNKGKIVIEGASELIETCIKLLLKKYGAVTIKGRR